MAVDHGVFLESTTALFHEDCGSSFLSGNNVPCEDSKTGCVRRSGEGSLLSEAEAAHANGESCQRAGSITQWLPKEDLEGTDHTLIEHASCIDG
jgi:hypothetical protein